jgi:Ni/Co efflux regulator RcnB
MIKRAMIAFAASAAAVPAALPAQTVSDPGLSWNVPNMSLALPAAAAAAAAPAPLMRHDSPPTMRHGPGQRVVVRHGGGMGGHDGTRRFRRIARGGMIPHIWFGPQFHVRNWGLYGFPQPFAGGRWVRYYDDALLVDRDGRVRDGRYGTDWDRYGERWDRDEDGVPVYAGNGDYEPGDYDYEWAERYEREHGRDEDRGYGDRGHDREVGRTDVLVRRDGHGGPGCDGRVRVEHRGYGGCGAPPPPRHGCGNPCGQGYGYGYGWYGWGPVIVTETIVTTAPVVETRTYYETVTERVRVAPRKVYRAPRARPRPAPPPRPRPGERG